MKSSENLDIVDVVLVSLLLTLNILHTFFLVFLLLALNRCMFAGKHSLQIEKIYKFNSSVEVQLPSMDYSDRFHSSFLNFWVTYFWKLTPWSILKFLPSDVFPYLRKSTIQPFMDSCYRCYKNVFANRFLPRADKLCNPLLGGWFSFI